MAPRRPRHLADLHEHSEQGRPVLLQQLERLAERLRRELPTLTEPGDVAFAERGIASIEAWAARLRHDLVARQADGAAR